MHYYYLFQAKSWSSVVEVHAQLDTVHRQGNVRFREILNELRVGDVSQKSMTEIRQLERSLPELGLPVCNL